MISTEHKFGVTHLRRQHMRVCGPLKVILLKILEKNLFQNMILPKYICSILHIGQRENKQCTEILLIAFLLMFINFFKLYIGASNQIQVLSTKYINLIS